MGQRTKQISAERESKLNIPIKVIPKQFTYWKGHQMTVDDFDRYFDEFKNTIGRELVERMTIGQSCISPWESEDSIMTITFELETRE